MKNYIQNKPNTSKKEKDELLSLFRIPVTFFSDNNKLRNYRDKMKKLKEEVDKQNNELLNKINTEIIDNKSNEVIENTDITTEPTNQQQDITDTFVDEQDITGELDNEPDVMDELDDETNVMNELDDEPDVMDELDDETNAMDELDTEPDVMDELNDEPDVMDELDDKSDNDKAEKKSNEKDNNSENNNNEKNNETDNENSENKTNTNSTDNKSSELKKEDNSGTKDSNNEHSSSTNAEKTAPSQSTKGNDNSAIDNARKMDKKSSDLGNATKDATKNTVGDAAKNATGEVAKNATGEIAKNAAGNVAGSAGAALGAVDALKNAKDDPEGAAGQLAVEGLKGASTALNAVAPGVGTAVSKGIDVIDKTVGQTEVGKKGKRCCGTCICGSCLMVISAVFLPILLMLMTFSSIFGSNDVEEEEKERNFIEIIQENEDLANPKSYLTDILDDTLKKVKYPEYKEAIDAGEEYKDTNGSLYILSIMAENYSIANLKEAVTTARPEDFPIDEDFKTNGHLPYYSMEDKHIPLFQEVLDNVLEKELSKLSAEEKIKATVLKNRFNYDTEMVKFIDEITNTLDKKYKIFNFSINLFEDDISLRDLLEETSIYYGDERFDADTVATILHDRINNTEIIEQFYELQEQLAKLEILTYMQAYRQYNIQISDMRRTALESNYSLPDVYYSDEFFEQFSTITDLATYVSLAVSTATPSLVYEIACDTISIWNDPPELTAKTFNGKEIRYIPILETWYANYTFDLITTGETAILKCTGAESRQLDEKSWEDSSNLLKRYNIDDKEQFFALFKTATGIDPVEGEDNIYSPAGLDSTWQTEATFNIGSTKAYSSGVYSYNNSYSSYSSNSNSSSPSYSYSTTTYLTETGGSFPVATNSARITMNFMERYPQYIIDQYGTSEYHRGIDYAVSIGTPVLAIRDGTITYAGPSSGYGYYVEVTHSDGSRSRYGHGNGVFNVKEGDTVTAGTQIMESGNSGNSTGPHMHLEVIGANGNLIDPNKYIYGNPF